MLNLDTYSYIVEFYYRKALSAIYGGCVQLIGVHLDWRVEDDVMKILQLNVKQRIPSVGEFKSSSRCSDCNRKGHKSRTCKVRTIRQKM